MPRTPTLDPAGSPVHVVQRGRNRAPCFLAEEDRLTYLHYLAPALGRFDTALHAYALMTNHVHLVLTAAAESGISCLLQLVGQRYAQYLKRRYGRSDTAWEDRHQGSVIDSESYLLASYRYVERNPVRAGFVATASEYPWSSYAHHAGVSPDPLIREHPVYLALGRSASERAEHYVALVAADDPDADHEVRTRLAYAPAPAMNAS